MARFKVNVRRITYEDVELEVEALHEDEARWKAELEAPKVPLQRWNIYNCDYVSDEAIPM